MAEVYFTERGRDRLHELDTETQERIKQKLGEIQDWPDHFLKPLIRIAASHSGIDRTTACRRTGKRLQQSV